MVTPITDYINWKDRESAGAYVSAFSADTLKAANRIWASHIRDLIFLVPTYGPRVRQVKALDRKPLVEVEEETYALHDTHLWRLNRLIAPYPFGFTEMDVDPALGLAIYPNSMGMGVPMPSEYFAYLEEKGALALRERFLAEGFEKAKDDELASLFQPAIQEMYEALAVYRDLVLRHIEEKERQVLSVVDPPGGIREKFDPRDDRYFWLLGRKKKSAHMPQVVIQPGMAAADGEAIGNSIAQSMTGLVGQFQAMMAQEREQIAKEREQMKAEIRAELAAQAPLPRPRLQRRHRPPIAQQPQPQPQPDATE
jgi:hypothetical protein